jgi:hypothetical protein
MLREIKLNEIIGKKIMGHALSITNCQMVIMFSDRTFTTLGVSLGYERGDEEIVGDTLEIMNFGHDKLVFLGIVSQKELEDESNKRAKEFTLKNERRELSEYNRLKAKFGGKA